jgi:hypothetical protein
MTVLRFGTDTGHVTWRVESKLTSVGGDSSQRVTTLELAEGLRACTFALWRATDGLPTVAGGFEGNGRGEKPQGGWSHSSEWSPGLVGSTPWSAATPRGVASSDAVAHG